LRDNVDPATGAIKTHLTINQRKNRVVAAEADVLAGQKLRAALADDDVAGNDGFAAKFLYAEPLADAVATVLDAALSLFMSHLRKLDAESDYSVTSSLLAAAFLDFEPRLMPVIFTRVNLRR
jgi:hypothetical protein